MLRTWALLATVVVGVGAATAVGQADEQLAAGVATVEITPPLKYRMSGYFYERVSTGVKDPLMAKALVLRQGDAEAALVFCDLIGMSPDVSAAARKMAEKETGIPAANIVIAATHSHTGPMYFGELRRHFHDSAVKQHGSDPLEEVDYPAQLAERLVEAIRKARESARPARLKSGTAEQLGLSFNRRFHMKDGTVRFNPGVLNPDIVRPAGPIDPEVGIVLVEDAESSAPLAVLTVFALHLDTVGGTEYSADFPYYLEKTLREKLGGDVVSLFGAGTCGDVNHIDVTNSERLKTDFIGTTLGNTVLSALPDLKAVAEPALSARSSIVQAPIQEYTEEEIAQAAKDMFRVGTRELSFLEQVTACKITSIAQRGVDKLPAEVQVLRLGNDTAIVALPGEVFVDLGLAIKRASPFQTTLVVELSQDAPGYIPTKKGFAEGSYETVNSIIATGGGEMMVEEAIRLLKELKPQR
jgi:hypothetical protein